MAALLLVAVVLATNRAYVLKNSLRNETKVIAEIAMRHGLQSERHLQVVAKSIPALNDLLPILRAAQHAPFNWQSACEEKLGEQIPEPGGEAAGSMETLTAYAVWNGTERALELSGWAEQAGEEADCVVIVDGNRTVIGAGASVSQRPDIERVKGRALGPVGWKAVASVPQSTPICALALFPDDPDNDGPWEPLANCQTSIESGAEAPPPPAPAETPSEAPGP
jgi:hypothetical protein